MYIKRVLTLLLLLSHFTLVAAEFSRYLNNYSVEDGLSQSYVNQTIQDNIGYLWIATDYGLNRFNGYQIERIHGPDNVFSTDGILFMTNLSNGKLLISTYYTGAYVIDPNSLQAEQIYDGKLTNNKEEVLTVEFALEYDGQLWLAIGKYLVKYEMQHGRLQTMFELNDNKDLIRHLYVHDDILFIASSNGLYRYRSENSKATKVPHLPLDVTPSFDNSNTKFIVDDDELGLLIGTVDGLYALKSENGQYNASTLLSNINIWDMVKHGNAYYLATDNGLYQYAIKTKKLKPIARYSERHPLVNNNKIRDIFIDKSGLLWLASETKGVYYWNPDNQLFTSISNIGGVPLSSPLVNDVLFDSDDSLWVATQNGLNHFNVKNKEVKSWFVNQDVKQSYGQHTIYQLFQVDDAHFWMFHGDGLSLFNTKRREIVSNAIDTTLNEEFAKLSATSVYPITRNRFIVLSYTGHFILDITNSTLTAIESLNKKFDTDLSVSFMKSFVNNDGVLYVTGGAIYHYDYTSDTLQLIHRLKNYQIHDFKFVTDWHRDSNGNIWLSYNGLGIIQLNKEFDLISQFTYENGLVDNRVFAISEDKNNHLWINSQSGLFRYTPKNHTLLHYKTDHGLLSNELGYVSKQMENGDFLVNSVAGMITFDPDTLPSTFKYSKKAKLLDVQVASRAQSRFANLHDVTLKHDDYGIQFTYSNFDYATKKDTYYIIELTGPTLIEYPEYTSNTLDFSHLQPGKYVLRITATTRNSVTQAEPLEISLTVKHNPLTSPLTIALYVILSVGFFLLLLKRRSKQQALLLKAHEQSTAAQQRAQFALDASNSGVWVYDSDTQFIYHERFSEDLGYDNASGCTLETFLALIHENDVTRLKEQWSAFTSGNISLWDVTYRVKSKSGQWQWYRDMGRLSEESIKSDALIYTGTYTNISETKQTQQQAMLYSEALEKMNEWLLILGENLEPVTSNPAFNQRFISQTETLSSAQLINIFDKFKFKKHYDQVRKLAVGEKIRFEESVATNSGELIPVSISVSAIGVESVSNYVVVLSDLTQQKKVERELTKLANYDHLTGLPNRILMQDRIKQAIVHSQNTSIALLFIDLDRFKQVNDSFGHAMGDLLLNEVACRLKAIINCQSSVGRQSGDEFIVLVDTDVSPKKVSDIANRIIHALNEPFLLKGNRVHISSSVGIALYPFDARSPEELIQNADIAMIHAKSSGKNCFRFYTESMNKASRNRLLLENELVDAVQENRFTNYYQPIINVELSDISGVELLLRWFNNGQFVSPAQFIPIAEQSGQIIKITEHAITNALIELKPWLLTNSKRYVSINLSAYHFAQHNLTDSILKLLARSSISPQQIRLELTENILIEGTSSVIEQLNQLKDAGFKLFLDDFGTGYSSLTYLSQFPVDVIKIDQSFVKTMSDSKTNQAIVKTIVTLAHTLDNYCIAEGVEQISQLSMLKRLGCTNFQGYYFAKPMPICEFLSEATQNEIARKIKISKSI